MGKRREIEPTPRSTIEAFKARLHGEPCPVAGCPGDGRYAPPGRGHACTTSENIAAQALDTAPPEA